ncbi:MAG: hypothetical protein AAGC55_22475, partial [Myxococcota bacterium]
MTARGAIAFEIPAARGAVGDGRPGDDSLARRLRAPLSALVEMSERMAETALTQEQRGYVRSIQDSSTALLALTDELACSAVLDPARAEAARAPLDPGELVEELVEELHGLAAAKGVGLTTYRAVDLPRQVVGDAGGLAQVLRVLLGRALASSGAGHVFIGVFAEAVDDATCSLHVEIRETGAARSEAREPARIAAQAMATGGATLTAVRARVAQMGGRLDVLADTSCYVA